MPSDSTTNHMPQNPTSFLPLCPHTVHPAIRISEKDGTRPGFCYEQGSCRAWRSHTGAIRTVEAIFSDRSRITEGRQTGPSLSPPLNIIQWISRAVVCSKRRRAGDLLSVCLKHVKPAGTSLSPYNELDVQFFRGM
jgi:hypothetical protein